MLNSALQMTYQDTQELAARPRVILQVAEGVVEEEAAVEGVEAWTVAFVGHLTHVHLVPATLSPSCAYLATSVVVCALVHLDISLEKKKKRLYEGINQ